MAGAQMERLWVSGLWGQTQSLHEMAFSVVRNAYLDPGTFAFIFLHLLARRPPTFWCPPLYVFASHICDERLFWEHRCKAAMSFWNTGCACGQPASHGPRNWPRGTWDLRPAGGQSPCSCRPGPTPAITQVGVSAEPALIRNDTGPPKRCLCLRRNHRCCMTACGACVRILAL